MSIQAILNPTDSLVSNGVRKKKKSRRKEGWMGTKKDVSPDPESNQGLFGSNQYPLQPNAITN